ncbi:MAG TPA: hypothetical protein VFZ64_10285 [Nocardioidaceae bacterium]
MSYLTKIAAALAAAAILFLSPGAHAVIPDDTWGPGRSYADDQRMGASAGFADDRRANTGQAAAGCPEGMMQTFCRHYGLETEATATAAGGRRGVADEPDTTGQVIGWTAAGVAVVSAGVAGVILIRRRQHHGELPHAA